MVHPWHGEEISPDGTEAVGGEALFGVFDVFSELDHIRFLNASGSGLGDFEVVLVRGDGDLEFVAGGRGLVAESDVYVVHIIDQQGI